MNTQELLLHLVARSEGRALSPDEVRAIGEIILDHDWVDANRLPEVMLILERLLDGPASSMLLSVPAGYPFGMGGMANVFLDLAEKFESITWDDHGEDALGEFRGLRRSLYCNQEAASPFCGVRPLESLSERNAWLHQAYRRRR